MCRVRVRIYLVFVCLYPIISQHHDDLSAVLSQVITANLVYTLTPDAEEFSPVLVSMLWNFPRLVEIHGDVSIFAQICGPLTRFVGL